jgi:hypothetical protein
MGSGWFVSAQNRPFSFLDGITMYLLKKNELIKLIKKYFFKEATLKELQIFATEIIDYFTDTQNDQLPPYQDFEDEFWHAIWQLQHVADSEHEKEGVTANELSKALDYLLGTVCIPKEYIGKRPK